MEEDDVSLESNVDFNYPHILWTYIRELYVDLDTQPFLYDSLFDCSVALHPLTKTPYDYDTILEFVN